MGKKLIRTAPEIEDVVHAKLFMNGGSQAVRIPAKWRLDHDEVEISWNEEMQCVMIRSLSREEIKAMFIAQVKALTPEEKKQIKNDFSYVRDRTPWTPNPKFAEVLGPDN